jgi:hypothetical protein
MHSWAGATSIRDGASTDSYSVSYVKTRLRNCMNSDTSDALMMIASNGSELDDTAAVRKPIDEASDERADALPCSKPPGCLQTYTQQNRTVPFHDLLHEQECAARAAKADLLSVLHDSDDNVKSVHDGDGKGMTATEDIQASHDPYTPPTGWKFLY